MNKPLLPEDVPKLFVENWNNRRPDLMAALFEEDADFINVVGLWWTNREAIFNAHDYGLKVIFKDSSLKIIKLKIKMLSNEIAIIHAKMELTGQTAVGNFEGGVRRTVFSFIVRKKEDGLWWAVSAQNTDIVPGAETNILSKTGEFKPVNYRK